MLAVVALFLLAMAGLGVFGRFRIGGARRKPRARRCPACGRHRVGPGPCECGQA